MKEKNNFYGYVFQSPAILHVFKYVKMQEAQLFMGVILDN